MRIVAGEFGGRKLLCPRTLNIRPAQDRVREALFQILSTRCEGASVLDLYSGVGSIGLEALSRGAERVTFVDYAAQSLKYIRKNSAFCKERVDILPVDVKKAPMLLQRHGKAFDLIFLDPPFLKGLINQTLNVLDETPIFREDYVIIARHHKKEEVRAQWNLFELFDRRQYGDSIVLFFKGRI